MIYITGDTHGNQEGEFKRFNSKNFNYIKSDEEDYLIILGDFGIFFEEKLTPESLFWLKNLNTKPYKILFIDGNHENFDILETFEDFEFAGGIAKKINIKKEFTQKNEDLFFENIIYLKRGEIYTLNNKKFLVMGGAFSGENYVNYEQNYIKKKLAKNKYLKKENIKVKKVYWSQEIPSDNEFEKGFNNLKNNKVDYILSHTAPTTILSQIYNLEIRKIEESSKTIYSKKIEIENMEYILERVEEDKVSKIFDEWYKFLNTNKKYIKWFFGHTHLEYNIRKNNIEFINLYKRIISIL